MGYPWHQLLCIWEKGYSNTEDINGDEMNLRFIVGTGISLFVMAMTLSGIWAVMRYKTNQNCKNIKTNRKRIDAVEDAVLKTETVIKERLPKDLPRILGKIEQQLKQLNSK